MLISCALLDMIAARLAQKSMFCFQITVETPWADRTVNVDVTTKNIPCHQLMVAVKLTWDSPYGLYYHSFS